MVDPLKGIDILTSSERPRSWRYTSSAGPIRSKFLLYLRDQQKIMGTKCSICGRVYIPARSVCLECHEDMEEWIEVSKSGVLETYTIVYEQSPIPPSGSPFAMGVINHAYMSEQDFYSILAKDYGGNTLGWGGSDWVVMIL